MKAKIALLFFLAIGLSSCEQSITLRLSSSFDVTIPSATIVNINTPYSFRSGEQKVDHQSTFENNNTRKDLIEGASLDSVRVTILHPQDQDFAFVNSIYVYLNASDLEETLIAYEEDIPDNVGQELVLKTTGEDIAPFVREDTLSIRIETKVEEIQTRDIEVQTDIKYTVQAKLSSALL